MAKKDELIKQCRDILAASPFAETEVLLTSGQSMLTRYGDNKITQNVEQLKNGVRLRAIERTAGGAKTAAVECDQLDGDSIAKAYERLKKVLRVLPGSEEVAGLLPKGGRYAEPRRLNVALPDPELAARAIGRATRAAETQGFQASGVFSADHQIQIFANSSGLLLSDELSDSEFSCTVEGRGGAGRGFSHQADPSKLSVDLAVETALAKCKASSQDAGEAVALSPGAYDVVLEPAALAEVLVFFGWVGLSAKAYLEERAFCHGKLGGRVFTNERVSLVDDPLDPEVAGSFFDGQGVPKNKVSLVERGVLKTLASDVKTAERLKTASTGHGMAEPNASDPVPWNIGLEWSGEKAQTTAELVARVKRGVLVTQFHYTNLVDVMVPSLTGMTRNGTFLIEDGRITRPVRNMRFTQSMVDFFNNVDGVTERRERMTTFFGGASLCPSALVRGFHFSSGTEF